MPHICKPLPDTMRRLALPCLAGMLLAGCGDAAPGQGTQPAGDASPVPPPTASATPSREAADLRVGVFVLEDSDCSDPANAAIRIHDGQGISGSATRDCRMTVRTSTPASSPGRYEVDQSCIDTYDGERRTEQQVLEIAAPDRFTLTTPHGAGTYRLCPDLQIADLLGTAP